MNIERKDIGNVSILRLAGDIDEAGLDVVRTALYELLAEGRHRIVVNLSGVRFISYIGIGVLVEALRKRRALNGDIKLVGMNLYAQRLFRMVGVSALFDAYESETQAIGHFQETNL